MWQLSHVALHHRRSKRLAPRRAQRRPHGEAGVLPDGRVRARADRPPAHALGRALPPAQQRAARVRVAGLRGAAPRRAARGVCRGGRSVAAAVHALRVWGSSSRLHHRLCCRGEAARSARRCAAAKLRPSSLCLCDSLTKANGLETLPHGGIMTFLNAMSVSTSGPLRRARARRARRCACGTRPAACAWPRTASRSRSPAWRSTATARTACSPSRPATRRAPAPAPAPPVGRGAAGPSLSTPALPPAGARGRRRALSARRPAARRRPRAPRRVRGRGVLGRARVWARAPTLTRAGARAAVHVGV